MIIPQRINVGDKIDSATISNLNIFKLRIVKDIIELKVEILC